MEANLIRISLGVVCTDVINLILLYHNTEPEREMRLGRRCPDFLSPEEMGDLETLLKMHNQLAVIRNVLKTNEEDEKIE